MKKTILVLAAMALTGCSQQEMAKNYGGTSTTNLEPGKRLVTITWKDSHLWYLVRDRKADEKPERYEFKESSSWGALNGTVVIQER